MTVNLTCDLWPVGPYPCEFECESPTITGSAVEIATNLLDMMTGHRFGTCTETLRPCRRECVDYPWPDAWRDYWPGDTWVSPLLWAGKWYNIICGQCGTGCSCSQVSEVVLPGPIAEIIEVKIDGTPLATGSYRVDNGDTLIRVDGGEWPRCNNYNLADTEPDTWSIRYTRGYPVPEGGKWAMGELVCQLIQAMSGEDCALPKQVVSLVRQGVTIQMPPIHELFEKGQTGMYLVDQFINTYNPNGLRDRARVYSVDDPIQHRRAGTT